MITKKYLLSFLILSLFFSFQFSFSANTKTVQASSLWDTVYDGGLDEIAKEAYDENNKPADVRKVIVDIIKVFLTLVGIIFVVLIILAGYTWMTSQGNEDKIKEAKSRIITGIIGLAIIIAAYAIALFVEQTLIDAINDF